VRVLHFSDIHLGLGVGRVPARDWPGKRLAGGLNLLLGRDRLFTDAATRVAALADLLVRESVDLVVFSGDFTAMGTGAELAAARALVKPFLEVPGGFVCVPGNHDLYAPDVVRERRFETHFRELLRSDLPEHAVDGPWPLVRLFADVAVVAVNSARPNRWPWRSSGAIPRIQLDALATVLARSEFRDRPVLAVTHYAPCLDDGGPDRLTHRMDNAQAFLDACAGTSPGAILCGHVHHTYRVRVPGIGPEILCAGSATMSGHEGFWMLDIEDGRLGVRRGRWTEAGFEVDPESSAS
jgi:3',5'-cyclic AMP phosphodiesterase CpdA